MELITILKLLTGAASLLLAGFGIFAAIGAIVTPVLFMLNIYQM